MQFCVDICRESCFLKLDIIKSIISWKYHSKIHTHTHTHIYVYIYIFFFFYFGFVLIFKFTNNCKLILANSLVICLLVFHFQKERFHFLDDYRSSHSWTTFYFTIAALIFIEDSLLTFKSSMDPLPLVCNFV